MNAEQLVAVPAATQPPHVRALAAELARPVDAVILKLAARCNLACDYCYWFRDPSVMALPKRLSDGLADLVASRIREHLLVHRPPQFTVILHGGEPLLMDKAAFWALCEKLREAEAGTDSRVALVLTTNAVLVDADWALIFRHFGIAVTVSLDGPADVHDRHRGDLRGRPTHARVLDGIAVLRAHGIEPGVLSVIDPASAPGPMLDHMVRQLGLSELDFLIPDAIHGDSPASVAPFLIALFDAWWQDHASAGVRIRLFDAIIAGLLGGQSNVESIGLGPVRAVTITTAGIAEAHDVCRITGNGTGAVDLANQPLDAIRSQPEWQAILRASLTLPSACQACRWRTACGGGHVAGRWSHARDFDNPSVYCADLLAVLDHVWAHVRSDLILKVEQNDNVGG